MRRGLVILVVFVLAACVTGPQVSTGPALPSPPSTSRLPVAIDSLAGFDNPAAFAFFPGTDWVVVTERTGHIWVRTSSGMIGTKEGLPEIAVIGDGGLGDIVAAPSFAGDHQVFLTWTEAGLQGHGAVVGRATLQISDTKEPWSASLADLKVIWRQTPKVAGHEGLAVRMAISPDGKYLFVASSDRGDASAAVDLSNNLGKIVRLKLDGTPATGNPFADRGGVSAEIWSYGHHRPGGLAFDADQNLWCVDPVPTSAQPVAATRDRLDLIVPGTNYQGPGRVEDPTQSQLSWGPSVQPSSLLIYTGNRFPNWKGQVFVSGDAGPTLIEGLKSGKTLIGVHRWEVDHPVRAMAQAPDGAIWLLEGSGSGRLLRLTPKS